MNNDRITALEQQLTAIQAEIEQLKAEEAQVKPWRAECGEVYYNISGNGTACGNYEGSSSLDTTRYDNGNYYRTYELAQQDAKELALRGRVRQLRDALCEGYQFKYGKENYCIQYDGMFGELSVECTDIQASIAEIYFDTKDHAQTACDILNAELAKKE